MKSLKITRLMSLLTAGIAVGGTVSGVVIYNDLKQNNDVHDKKITLDSYNCVLSDKFQGAPSSETLMNSFINKTGLRNIDELTITNVNHISHTFQVVGDQDSPHYNPDHVASCSWNIPMQGNEWTTMTGTAIETNLKKFNHTESGKQEILDDLQNIYPDLKTDELEIDFVIENNSTKTLLKTSPNSSTYPQTQSATLMENYNTPIEFYYANTQLTPGTNSGAPVFKIFGTDQIPTYSISPAITSNVTSFLNGTLSYTAAREFIGCMYTITASYVSDEYTYIARSQVFCQSNSYINITPTYYCSLSYYNQEPFGFVKNNRLSFGTLFNKSAWAINNGNTVIKFPNIKVAKTTICWGGYFADATNITKCNLIASVSGNDTILTYSGPSGIAASSAYYFFMGFSFEVQ